MMMLSDIRDYIESLNLSEHVYMAKLDAKQEKSIGVYGSKHDQRYKTAIGGPEMESFGTKYITLLIHWNKSYRDTEAAANALFEALGQARDAAINGKEIKFILPLTREPVNVGTDDSGVYEMVIEAAVTYRKGE